MASSRPDMDRAVQQIHQLAAKLDRTINLMEVCGTHTVSIFRHGIRRMIPANIRLVSGPGCPVCVTSIADVDRVIALARHDDTILTTFGDMMRVPGKTQSLTEARADGADIRVVYSPMDCLAIARAHPGKKIVFFATGFETTSPSIAATIEMADIEGIDNFFIYSVHKTVPPALRVLMAHPDIRIDGFILPGHVSTIIGRNAYRFLSDGGGVASVIAGFGGEDIIQSILMLLVQISERRAGVDIQYRGAVRDEGNPRAIAFLEKYFTAADVTWRGVGVIEKSGLVLRPEHERRNILTLRTPETDEANEPAGCRCGEVLIGKITPPECPLFGTACTPEQPVGACMVSTEGSCSAYFKYGGD